MNTTICTKPLTLVDHKRSLESDIESAIATIQQIKEEKKYSAKARKTITNLQESIKHWESNLVQVDLAQELKAGDWVKKKGNSTIPGIVEQVQIVGRIIQVQVKWWGYKVPIPETPVNLQKVNSELLDYVWSGEDYPRLVRRIDHFECDDISVLEAELNSLLPDQDLEKVYLAKRIKLLNPESVIEHKSKQIKALLEFADRAAQTQTLDLALIRKDGGTQQRLKLNQETVTEYAEAMRNGDKFPPVKVIFDGQDYWLYDGFHTTEAAWSIGEKEIEILVKPGTKREAILESVSVNADHGLRRTNADKRKAVMTLLQDEEWAKWSDREIARRCKVDHKTVGKIRTSLTGEIPSDNPKYYKDKHGNINKMDTFNIGKHKGSNPSDVLNGDKNTATQTDIISNKVEQKKPEPVLQILETLKPNDVVKVQLTSFDGVEEEVKIMNHRTGVIVRKTDIGNAYLVKFCRGEKYILKQKDLTVVEEVPLNTIIPSSEYAEMLTICNSEVELMELVKKRLLEGRYKFYEPGTVYSMDHYPRTSSRST